MKNLYILGAGGCGRETLLMLHEIQAIQGQRWNIIGFLDDTEDPLHGKACDLSVVGSIKDFFPQKNDVLVMAIAEPSAKEKIATLLKERGAVFETVIHPHAGLGKYNSIGEGTLIYGSFGMTVNISIGSFCTLLACTLGHDVIVGNFSTISSYSNIMGHVSIGEKVFIGGNVAVAPHAIIGDGAYVGVGSVVLKRVKMGEKVFGNPAREIGL